MINRKHIEEKIQEALKKKVLISKEALMDMPLDELGEIAHKIDVCPKELAIYLTCGGDCVNCNLC